MSIRKIFYTLIILSFLTVAVVVVLYRQLDIESYRHTLEKQLSSSLQQPVSIGQGRLTFRNGLAIDLRDLRVGPEDQPLVEIPQLTATLKIEPLLQKQILLDQVKIDSPRVHLKIPFTERPERGTTHEIFGALGIQTLNINNASLSIVAREGQQQLRLEEINARLLGWQAEETGELVASGKVRLPGGAAEFILNVNLPTSPDAATWRLEPLDYQLTVQNLPTALLAPEPGGALPSRVNLQFNLRGTPAQGALLTAEILGSRSQKSLFHLAGIWSSDTDRERLEQLKGAFFGLPLQGTLELAHAQGRSRLRGELSADPTPLDNKVLQLWQSLGADKLQSGELKGLRLSLDQSWSETVLPTGIPNLELQLGLTDLHWNKPELQQLEELQLQLSLANNRLKVSNSLLQIGDWPITCSGAVDQLLSDPRLDLTLSLTPDLVTLGSQLSLPAGWTLSGPLPSKLHLQGDPRQPNFKLSASLNNGRIDFGQILQKTSAASGSLEVIGQLTDNQLELQSFTLQLGRYLLSGQGSLPRLQPLDNFQLSIDPSNLQPLQELSPLLQKIRLNGEIQGSIKGAASGPEGQLSLNGVGSHLFNFVGDLNQTHGELFFDASGAHFNRLSARLGSSLLQLSGDLGPWSDPQLQVHVRGDEILAGDLIFPNQELRLYDLEGHVRINRQGIYFEPVNVRLEESTRARVTGKVAPFDAPQVELDIQGENANILQVIALFEGPRKIPAQAAKHQEHKPVLISVRASQGTLADLRFTNAYGEIRDHAGVFTLYPLSFETGDGFCNARVEFDRNHPTGLLKVSGHAENVDATILHQDLFKDRGLIKGALRGDFYVEGSPKEGFWKSSLGGVHLQVKDGVLRKFRGLSSVFSILNVSQLFSFKLPDVDTEGMPFQLMEGSFQIAEGALRTEDLHINSEAMNLSVIGEQDLVEDRLNFNLGVMPLRTVDKVVTSIPLAGWVLAGEDKALLTAHFKIEGPSKNPTVTPVPIDSLSGTVFGIVKRTLGLPGKMVKDLGSLFQQAPEKKKE